MENIMKKEFREVEFLKNFLKDNKLAGFVIGVSGGIDSAVCLSLACKAAGAENVFALLMPYLEFPMDDAFSYKDSVVICDRFNVERRVVNIEPMVTSFGEQDAYHRGNIMARVRMTLLYNEAAKRKYAVINTCNLSEDLIGYSTKYGDAAGDIAPIAHLMKHQVYKLAEQLEIPEHLINRVPSAGLWPRQTDEGELGFTYEELDSVINAFLEYRIYTSKCLGCGIPIGIEQLSEWMAAPDEVNSANIVNIAPEKWELIRNRAKAAIHKMVPMPNMLYVLSSNEI